MVKKHKVLNVSFKTFVMHILAQLKRHSSVRQRRRHSDVSSFTVNLGSLFKQIPIARTLVLLQ